MEERSLRVYEQKTFFSKIGTTISKILIPTKIGFNGMMISVKRNNLLKAYEAYKTFNEDNTEKREHINQKYEDTFALYLESIDKYVMDSIYKKVKNGNASPFEQDALSRYYVITHLKETQYLEYKYRKQKYLLELDYESVKGSNKEKLIQKYNRFYVEKMDTLYKGILKNYSVQLADNLKTSANDKAEIYDKVFDTIEEYIVNILTIKMKSEEYKIDKETLEQYDKYSKFLAGKPDSIDVLEKKMIILAISRKIFTHSLPLIIAEQCYEQLLNEVRSELVHAKNDRKFKKAYKMLLTILEEYNINLLSTKVYWERPKEREEYKKFWEKYKKIEDAKNTKNKDVKKEILFIKKDLKYISNDPKRYKLVINAYKKKLVELGAMKVVKDLAVSDTKKYVKKRKEEKMTKLSEVTFLDIEENKAYAELIEKVAKKAFEIEKIDEINLYINVILTNPINIKNTNKKYRNIDRETDVLSFPMFEKEEIDNMRKNGNSIEDTLGDVMISIPRVTDQAIEYGHSFERELSYMLIHGFYHLMRYDHMEEEDKKVMREKEEAVLNSLNITR